jgi:unsaturated chondroitin disaccharide hydrolase
MRKTFPRLLSAIVMLRFAAMASALPEQGTESPPPVDTNRAMEVAFGKLAAFDAAHPERSAYPTDAKGASWRTIKPGDWVAGFYPGCLWMAFDEAKRRNPSGANAWRTRAEGWTAGLTDRQFDGHSHDIGFVVFDSFGNGYRLTTNPAYLPVINQAAETLSTRFVPKTGMIRSWGKTDDKVQQVCIDNMMNLELLLWSAQHGGKAANGSSADLTSMARSHADRVLELFFRPDGSLYHVVDLDPATGQVIRKRTRQGKGDESAWSRGQTWAIYGFGTLYDYTKDPKYLAASRRAADYYIAHLPPDFIPPSDFDSTLTGLEFKDSSAAAVAASALIRLSRQVDDPVLKRKYFGVAEKTLASLTHPPYLAEGQDKAAILNYAARNYNEDPANPLTNTGLIFGDYYFLEALLAYEQAMREQPSRS